LPTRRIFDSADWLSAALQPRGKWPSSWTATCLKAGTGCTILSSFITIPPSCRNPQNRIYKIQHKQNNKMPTGSCMCGGIKYEYTGEPQVTALCHCTDCQKWSGGAYTSNIVVPRTDFKVTSGKPKEYAAVGNSGKKNNHFFCGGTLFLAPSILHNAIPDGGNHLVLQRLIMVSLFRLRKQLVYRVGDHARCCLYQERWCG
jgi:hypothetical protein